MDTPLVSIGLPVRNGGKTLRAALDNLLAQTYANIEIIVSDNNSHDDTREICSQYVSSYRHISYHRQSMTISALENFHFVLQQSHGLYFAWAAHDDLRSSNWISLLVQFLNSKPHSCMANSDYVIMHTPVPGDEAVEANYSSYFGHKLTSVFDLFNSRVHCIHTYGLYRTELLKLYSFRHIDYCGDHALVAFMSFIGDFSHCQGACFYYYYPLIPKSASQHAVETGGKSLLPFPRMRIAWYTARVLSEASHLNGRKTSMLVFLFPTIWIFHKSLIYNIAPPFAKRLWKNWKRWLNF